MRSFLFLLCFIAYSVSFGQGYWQQHVDYTMVIDVNVKNHTYNGEQKLVYTNNSPDVLNYLWIQLDQNVRAKNSASQLTSSGSMDDNMSFWSLKRMHDKINFDGGFKLELITDALPTPSP